MRTLNYFTKYVFYALLASALLVTGCSDDDDDPEPVNEEEVITDLKLIFTNDANASDVVEARAQDPDGDGAQELQVLDAINLETGKTYTLTFEIENNLEDPGEDIGVEINEEDDEHQFFFGFTQDAFGNPDGDGNIDNSADPLNYNDSDDNGNPVGLSTSWTTSSNQVSDGEFTVMLQHQPDLKDADTGADVGDSDIDVTFVLNIQ